MARRIYQLLLGLSVIMGIVLFMVKESHSKVFLIVFASLIFLLFNTGIHGLIAHSIKPKYKGTLIAYPIIMGVIWTILFFLFVFLFLPTICPDFHLYS
ncbi:hypothetical protein [uncultured Lutibacter sp.]|uniref:hypothetical protein n=1 Tax=uncultured Lutibacter sp. TaxID=437739 RepID=UPI0026017A16|nr:hypothetical protein [uncultured Lutibacter sp.]